MFDDTKPHCYKEKEELDTTSTATVEAPAKQYKLSDLILEGSTMTGQERHRYMAWNYIEDEDTGPLAATCANGAAVAALLHRLGLAVPDEVHIQWDRRPTGYGSDFKDSAGVLQALAMLNAYVSAPLLEPVSRELWEKLATPSPDEAVDPEVEHLNYNVYDETYPQGNLLSRAIDYGNYFKSREEVAELLASEGM